MSNHTPQATMGTKSEPLPVYQALIEEITSELNVRIREHGLFHPSLAESLNSMALVHLHMLHNPQEALKYHSKACAILLPVYKNEYESMVQQDRKKLSICLAVTYGDIGNVKWALHDYENAEKFYIAALDVFRTENLSDSHPRVYSVRNRLNLLHRYWNMDTVENNEVSFNKMTM